MSAEKAVPTQPADEDLIEVTIRTPQTGHVTLAVAMERLPALADHHLAEGRAVIAESGDESLLVRVGREILDFFRGRRPAGQPKPAERLTVTNPMRGGSGEGQAEGPAAGERLGLPTPDLADVMARVLLAAHNAARDQQAFYAGGAQPVGQPMMETVPARGRPLDPVAEMRAWEALVAKEGEGPAMALVRGGAIPVESSIWHGIFYLVMLREIRVVREGQLVSSLCLQVADGAPIYDAVVSRLDLLRAGIEGEVQVWAQSVATSYR